jgi:hypothetical protein
MTSTAKKVSEAHTDNLSASKGKETAQKKKAREQGTKSVSQAKELNHNDLVTTIGSYKITISSALDSIASLVSSQLENFKVVQEAIAFERKNLEELYGIKAEAESLDALMTANEAERLKFDEEKKAWLRQYEDQKKELQLQRKRDDDIYAYNRDMARKKDEDQWNDHKKQREQEFLKAFMEREDRILAKEKWIQEWTEEFNKNKARLQTYDDDKKKEVDRTVAIAVASQKKELEFTFQIEKANLQNSHNLACQQIQLLQGKVDDLSQQNIQLSAIAKDATQKVQEIAQRAVDSASKQIIVTQGSSDSQQKR